MDKDTAVSESRPIEAISTATSETQQQVQIKVEDDQVPVTYSSTVRVWGSTEEVNLDFAGPLRPSGPKTAKLKIDQRIVMNPWAAKRLCLALHQAIAKYEQTYGPLEVDPRKRAVKRPDVSPTSTGTTKPAGTTKLS